MPPARQGADASGFVFLACHIQPLRSHGDGVVGVAGEVPAGLLVGVRKEGSGAGDVFFGAEGVNLEIGFVALVRDREKANAVNGRSRSAKFGNSQANVIPGEIHGIDHKK
jgi:hypothetical protein